jgi:hypothetical protein
MAIDYAALQAELLAGHPTTGPYNADDAIAASELNALNRSGEVSPEEILRYCVETQHRENTGTDTQRTNIYGRIKIVAEAAEGSNPFGVSPAASITIGQIAGAKTVLRMLDGDAYNVNLSNTDIDGALTKCQGANCYSTAQKNEIVALGDNIQSRAQELGFGRVRAGDVAFARGL